MNETLEAKIVLLGDTGVGKTSLVLRYVSNTFSTNVNSTIGASYHSKSLFVEGTRLKLQLWDTAGQERFRSLAPMYYKGAAAALLVFDVTNEFSFGRVKDWVKELRLNVFEDIVVAIIGNQTDKREMRQVASEEGNLYAASIGAMYFECSARQNQGVDEMFGRIGKTLLDHYRATMKAFPGAPEPGTVVLTRHSGDPPGSPRGAQKKSCSC